MQVIPQSVTVRKNPVDIEGLQRLLKEHCCKTRRQIAEELHLPLTQVEHWFRTDTYFAIPEAEHWEALKNCIGITCTDFDKQVTEFEEVLGTFEKSERCYELEDCSPTLTCVEGGGVKIILYDDYNSYIPKEQNVMGSVTTQFSDIAVRHGFKIIEEKDEDTPSN